jgi:hypothetical protein
MPNPLPAPPYIAQRAQIAEKEGPGKGVCLIGGEGEIRSRHYYPQLNQSLTHTENHLAPRLKCRRNPSRQIHKTVFF